MRRRTRNHQPSNDQPPPKSTKRIHIPCIHIPYHDQKRLDHALNTAADCDEVILLGDVFDAYDVSSFDRDPNRKLHLQDELDILDTVLLKPIHTIGKLTDWIRGNHEERIPRYARHNAPGLATLRALNIESLVNLHQYPNITMHPRSGFKRYGIRCKHGDIVRKHSGDTAKAEMLEHRCNGVSAHTHRKGYATFRDKEGVVTRWDEAGHLCSEPAAEYVKNPNWNPGYLVETVHPDGSFERTFIDL